MSSTLLRVHEFFGTTSATPSPIAVPAFHREDFPRLFHTLGLTVGAEVGVETGRYSRSLCDGNPGVHLYCVDAWAAYEGYREHVPQTKVDGFIEVVKQRLAAFDGLEGRSSYTLVRDYSVPASAQFADASLDFVYIDANHTLPHVLADLAAWEPKVRPGGILAGHDFALRSPKYGCQVVEAVTAWTRDHGIDPWWVVGQDGLSEVYHRTAPSWLWVK